jgi:hypothetical protein
MSDYIDREELLKTIGNQQARCVTDRDGTSYGYASPTRTDAIRAIREAKAVDVVPLKPNLPMTLPALFELEEADAVWVVDENGRTWAMGAECAQEWAGEEKALFFAAKPTHADIEAARKEKAE